MALNEAYNNNNEGNAATLYGSLANVTEQEEKLADMGDQIREYIQQLTDNEQQQSDRGDEQAHVEDRGALDHPNVCQQELR